MLSNYSDIDSIHADIHGRSSNERIHVKWLHISFICLACILKLSLTICEANPSAIGRFPSQRAINAKRVSTPWHHHAVVGLLYWFHFQSQRAKSFGFGFMYQAGLHCSFELSRHWGLIKWPKFCCRYYQVHVLEIYSLCWSKYHLSLFSTIPMVFMLALYAYILAQPKT